MESHSTTGDALKYENLQTILGIGTALTGGLIHAGDEYYEQRRNSAVALICLFCSCSPRNLIVHKGQKRGRCFQDGKATVTRSSRALVVEKLATGFDPAASLRPRIKHIHVEWSCMPQVLYYMVSENPCVAWERTTQSFRSISWVCHGKNKYEWRF